LFHAVPEQPEESGAKVRPWLRVSKQQWPLLRAPYFYSAHRTGNPQFSLPPIRQKTTMQPQYARGRHHLHPANPEMSGEVRLGVTEAFGTFWLGPRLVAPTRSSG